MISQQKKEQQFTRRPNTLTALGLTLNHEIPLPQQRSCEKHNK